MSTIDFLGIGAARAGTTWLWNVLHLHPGIWMPPLKELHYFDRSPDYPSPSILANDHFFGRLIGTKFHNKLFRRLFLRSVGKSVLMPGHWRDLPWLFRYFTGTCSDSWYLSLFDGKLNKVKGEITPAYSILSKEDVQHVHSLLPEVKIIFQIRNPVARTWSGLRFRWGRKRLDIQNLDEIKKTVESPSLEFRGDYIQTIANWSACFPKEQFLICFFDELVKQPQRLMEKVFSFLGVDPSIHIPESILDSKINPARELDIPLGVKHFLAQKYRPEVERLIPLVGGYSETWLKEIEEMLI